MIRPFQALAGAAMALLLLAAGPAPTKTGGTEGTETVARPQAEATVQATAGQAVWRVEPASEFEATISIDDSVAQAAEGGSAAPAPPARADGSLAALVADITALPRIDLSNELRCLATAVYFESKGEPLEGQLAVAQVILNRVESGRWAPSICGVINQPRQFSFIRDGRSDEPRRAAQWRTAQAIALIAATDNWRPVVGDATHFHATRVAPGWRNLRRVSVIGNHVFYR